MKFDASKVTAVRQYLQGEFANQDVDDTYNSDCLAQDFRVGHGGASHLVRVSGEFFKDRGLEEIGGLLRRWKLAQTMRSVAKSRVIVTTKGLTTEPLGAP